MAKGIKINDSNELIFLNGDFFVDETDEQDMALIATMAKGDIANRPLVGAEIARLANSRQNDWDAISKDLKVQLEEDGFKDVIVDFRNNEIGGYRDE